MDTVILRGRPDIRRLPNSTGTGHNHAVCVYTVMGGEQSGLETGWKEYRSTYYFSRKDSA